MKSNDTNKKLIRTVAIFVGFMFFMPAGMIFSLDGFSAFGVIPLVMFAIFGLFIFNIVKSQSKNTNNNQSSDYNYTDDRHCISCHQAIAVNSEYCPYCGEQQTDHVICDYCGQQNSKHDLMCKNCNGLLK